MCYSSLHAAGREFCSAIKQPKRGVEKTANYPTGLLHLRRTLDLAETTELPTKEQSFQGSVWRGRMITLTNKRAAMLWMRAHKPLLSVKEAWWSWPCLHSQNRKNQRIQNQQSRFTQSSCIKLISGESEEIPTEPPSSYLFCHEDNKPHSMQPLYDAQIVITWASLQATYCGGCTSEIHVNIIITTWR